MVAIDDAEVQADEAQDEFAGRLRTCADTFMQKTHVTADAMCCCRAFSESATTKCSTDYVLQAKRHHVQVPGRDAGSITMCNILQAAGNILQQPYLGTSWHVHLHTTTCWLHARQTASAGEEEWHVYIPS